MVGAVLANRLAASLARATIFAVTGSLGKDPRPGEYDKVFFVVGEMRSGTSWLRRMLTRPREEAGAVA